MIFLFVSPPSRVHVQPAAANRVLELSGGMNSYVELPPNIFNHLDEAAAEAWAKQ